MAVYRRVSVRCRRVRASRPRVGTRRSTAHLHLSDVAGWGALPNFVVTWAAVPGLGPRRVPTSTSLPGATDPDVVATLTLTPSLGEPGPTHPRARVRTPLPDQRVRLLS